MTTPQEPAMGVSENIRDQFEVWVQKRHGVSIERWHDSGVYKYDDTKRWWECWLAALPHMQPAGEAVAVCEHDFTLLRGTDDHHFTCAKCGEAEPLILRGTPPAPVDVRLRELAMEGLEYFYKAGDEGDKKYIAAIRALLSAQPSADAAIAAIAAQREAGSAWTNS